MTTENFVSCEITFPHLLYIEDKFIYLKRKENFMTLLCLGITSQTV